MGLAATMAPGGFGGGARWKGRGGGQGLGCGGGGGGGKTNIGGSGERGEGKHVPLVGTCVQVVTTTEPTSRGVIAARSHWASRR
jgi:hypothetical protein